MDGSSIRLRIGIRPVPRELSASKTTSESTNTQTITLAEPFQEITSTLLITSKSGHYISLGIYATDCSGRPSLCNGIFAQASLHWAHAGQVTELQTQECGIGKSCTKKAHSCLLKHLIDSDARHGECPIVDRLLMYDRVDGTILTRRRCEDPITLFEYKHQEVWRPLQTARTCTPEGSSETVQDIVLVLDQPELQARGMIIRVGHYCQGMIMVQGVLTVERWQFMLGHFPSIRSLEAQREGILGDYSLPNERTKPMWCRTARMGWEFIPSVATFDARKVRAGDEYKYGKLVWKVL